MTRRTADENRRHVLETATRLFYAHGIRAVGMDQIIREAGVGNATVYRQFSTKDDLAAAYVGERAQRWAAGMRKAAERGRSPRERIVAVFTALAADVARPSYRGCPMLNTHTEFPDRDHPAHTLAVAHKREIRDWFRELGAEGGAADPEVLADQLLLVLNGTLSTAAMLDPHGPSRAAVSLVETLLDHALPQSRREPGPPASSGEARSAPA